jgi:hypothetical protein
MKEVFELGHVALYAKGHYLRHTSPHSEHDNIIQDLKPLILADGYCGDIGLYMICRHRQAKTID